MTLLDSIDFRAIGSIPQLIKDYLNGRWDQKSLPTEQNFKAKIALRAETFPMERRQLLAEVIRTQMSDCSLTERQHTALRSLEQPNSFTVTTGHQLNLFSGPVFFLYKIAQVLQLCKKLDQKFSDSTFVPIFWMATEDHDFEEINHFYHREHRYSMTGASGGAVGRIKIEDISFIDTFQQDIRTSPHATELVRLLKDCYVPGKTLAEATRQLVHRLFSEYGLLILDADDEALKKEATSLFAHELQNGLLEKATMQRVEALTTQYGKVQVNPRRVNLFYLNGQRDRIDFEETHFTLASSGRTFSGGEIVEELSEHPERFSPNALLRPVYQELILPNVAYVGGNAEIMYWLELSDLWQALQMEKPILVPRHSQLHLSQELIVKINKEKSSIADFLQPLPVLINRKTEQDSDLLPKLKALEETLHHQLDEMKSWITKTHPSFAGMVAAEEKRQQKSYERLRKRLLKAERLQREAMQRRLEKLYREIHPGGTWQERRENFSTFYAMYGKAWLDGVLAAAPADCSGLLLIED